MTTSRKNATISRRKSRDPKVVAEIEYYTHRLRTQIFEQVYRLFRSKEIQGSLTQADIAIRLDKDPARVCRMLSGPANWRIDTLAEFVFALDAEVDVNVHDRRRELYNYDIYQDVTASDENRLAGPHAIITRTTTQSEIVGPTGAGPAIPSTCGKHRQFVEQYGASQ